MPEIKLGKRLSKILETIPPCEKFADVGTDHALLPIEAVRRGIAKHAILTDVRKGPLSAAKKNLLQYKQNLLNFTLKEGNGLIPLENENPDVIAVCGMGGNLIADILRTCPKVAENAKKLILEPNTCWDVLREYLSQNGFEITDETTLAEDGHPYLIIEARYDGTVRTMDDYYLGEFVHKMDPDYKALLIKKSQNVLARVDSEFHKRVIEKLL